MSVGPSKLGSRAWPSPEGYGRDPLLREALSALQLPSPILQGTGFSESGEQEVSIKEVPGSQANTRPS